MTMGSGTAYDRHYRCIGAAEWTESELTASGKSLQSCHKIHYRVFMCTIRRKKTTSYDVSIGSWLDLLQLVWIGLA